MKKDVKKYHAPQIEIISLLTYAGTLEDLVLPYHPSYGDEQAAKRQFQPIGGDDERLQWDDYVGRETLWED